MIERAALIGRRPARLLAIAVAIELFAGLALLVVGNSQTSDGIGIAHADSEADAGTVRIGLARMGGPPIPTGAENLQEGVVRITPLKTAAPVSPDPTAALTPDRLRSFTVRIAAGHRLRVVLAAGSYALESSPSTGCPATRIKVKARSTQTVSVPLGCNWR